MKEKKSKSKGRTKNDATRSAYELMDAAGLIGCIKGLPKDLSTNKRYFSTDLGSLNPAALVVPSAFQRYADLIPNLHRQAPNVQFCPDGQKTPGFSSNPFCNGQTDQRVKQIVELGCAS